MLHKFTITEYDPVKRWLVVSNERHEVELDDHIDFHAWARERWPGDRYVISTDPQRSGWWERIVEDAKRRE